MNSGKICVSICSESVNEMIPRIKQAEQFADLIEIRFDCLRSDQLDAGLELTSSKPLIATFRSAEQGGKTDAPVADRQAFWAKAGNRFWAVDLEQDIFDTVTTTSKRILSFHDNDNVPDHLSQITEQMFSAKAEIVKIAVRTQDAVDGISVWKTLDDSRSVIPIAMGEAGKWTRILGPAHGAYLTYASLEQDRETAEGQLTSKDLVEVYRVKELDRDARVYGVIGYPIVESRSPYLHNPAFATAGLNSVFVPLQVRDLDAFITRMVKPATREVELNFGGFAVTMPHKQAIIKYLDEIDPVAEAIGAVNTVKIDGEKLTGFNTDAPGFIKPFKEHFGDLSGARVAVVGAGGASKAVVYALCEEDAEVTVLVREIDKAKSSFGTLGSKLSFLPSTSVDGFDIVVNATPVGMKGELEDKTLFTSDQLSGVKFLYDLVTRMTDTPLIAEAKKAGVPAIGGLEMLVAQAELQFEIWTGGAAPVGLMTKAALSRM